MNLSILYRCYAFIEEGFKGAHVYQQCVNDFSSKRTVYEKSPQNFLPTFVQNISKIGKEFLFLEALNSEQESIIRAHGWERILQGQFWKMPSKKMELSKGESSNIYSQFLNEISSFEKVVKNTTTLLRPLIEAEATQITDDEAYFELVFDNGIKIETITDAKQQFSSWFLILDGYSQLLGIRREDFLIHSISKNSPTTLRIKAKLEIVGLVLSIVSSVIAIAKSLQPQVDAVNVLKQQNLLPDSEMQQKFIEAAESQLSKDLDSKINEMVDQKIKEQGSTASSASLKKAIQQQFTFNVSGGVVNFYLNKPEYRDELNAYDGQKSEATQLLDSFKNVRLLQPPTSTNDSIVNR